MVEKLINCNLIPYPYFYIKIGGWWMVQNDAWVDSYNPLSYSMRTLYQVLKTIGMYIMPSGCLRDVFGFKAVIHNSSRLGVQLKRHLFDILIFIFWKKISAMENTHCGYWWLYSRCLQLVYCIIHQSYRTWCSPTLHPENRA